MTAYADIPIADVIMEHYKYAPLSGYVFVTVDGSTGDVQVGMSARNSATAYTLIGALESMKQELLELVAEENGSQGELNH